MGIDPRLPQLLAYASPYAASRPLKAPVARPADFLGANPKSCKWLFDRSRLPILRDEVSAALMRDDAPIPASENRENYNGDHHYAYWLSGYVSYQSVAAIAAEHSITSGRYFDFGGSTGRLFRHFHFQAEHFEVWSCDFKMSSVQWNLKHFPSAIKTFQNMYFPFLPMEDNSVDLLTAMSVFTHIDETETAWLLELRRILRPGGLALITVHDEHTWKIMCPELRAQVVKFSPDLAALAELPEGRHVSNWRQDDPYRCNVFESSSYIRQNWGRYFDVLDFIRDLFGHQSAVLLRKPG